MSVYGDRIKRLRESTGLDQPKLAFRCGWKGASRISNYETGFRTPKLDDVIKIGNALEPFLGKGMEVYILTGKTASEVTSDATVVEFTPQIAIKEFTSILSDSIKLGKVRLEPGLKIIDMVEKFSSSCGSYLSRKDNQKIK